MTHKKHQQLMAFDFGTKQIGIAVGQTLSQTAQALTLLKADNGAPDWGALDALILEWKPDAFVIGLPLNMDGSASHMSGRAKKFSNRLSDRYHKPCHLVDERLSSVEARESTKTNTNSNKKNTEIDSLAAAVILRSWLNEQANPIKP